MVGAFLDEVGCIILLFPSDGTACRASDGGVMRAAAVG